MILLIILIVSNIDNEIERLRYSILSSSYDFSFPTSTILLYNLFLSTASVISYFFSDHILSYLILYYFILILSYLNLILSYLYLILILSYLIFSSLLYSTLLHSTLIYFSDPSTLISFLLNCCLSFYLPLFSLLYITVQPFLRLQNSRASITRTIMIGAQ